jgi:ATP-dependent Lon protease
MSTPPKPHTRHPQNPRKRLPENPSAENLRKQAKQLARGAGLQLAAAQRRLAHEYGFQNWAALMDAVIVDRAVPLLPLRELIAFPYEIYPIYIGRPMSIRAVEAASEGKTPILMVAQKDARIPIPTAADMYEVGTLGTLSQWVKLGDGTIKAEIAGSRRARVSRYIFDQQFFQAECEVITESATPTPELDALMRSVVAAFDAYALHEGRIPLAAAKAFDSAFASIADPGFLSDKMVGHLKMPIEERQALLETIDPKQRLEKILARLNASR